MDSQIKTFTERANNELVLSGKIKLMSEDDEAKEFLEIESKMTFYSSVISHSYYAIFYAAKALLLTKNIKTDSPNVHKKTLDEFKKNFVDTGELDISLLNIYKEMIVRADELLEIFKSEKGKRGKFTYKTLPQANKEPAEDSLKNAKKFVSNINKVIENKTAKNKAVGVAGKELKKWTRELFNLEKR